jgi:hypothetical protein
VGWRDWLGQKDQADEIRPSLRDVKFDASGMKVTSKTPAAMEWTNNGGDRLTARIDRVTPERPFTPWTLDALRSAFRTAAIERHGGIVSLTFEQANAIPITRAITKFPEGMGYSYEGTLLIRFRDAEYSVTMQADEGRSTGTREAMVTGLLMQIGEIRIPVVIPPAVSANLEGWARDPYDDTFNDSATHSLADDDCVDLLLPEHPLSRVRRRLDLIQSTLHVAGDLMSELVEPAIDATDSGESRHRMSALALGMLFIQAGRPDLAEQHMTARIPLRDGDPILETPRVGDSLILLGVMREAMGRAEDALWTHQWAVRAFAATAGDDDPNAVRARANLGRVYAGMGRHTDAEPLLTGAIPAFERAENKHELSLASNALGLVRQSQERHSEAKACFERTLTLFEELHGRNYGESATVLKNLARSAEATGDRVGSARALKQAKEILWLQATMRH